ncbi:MAG: hypothetical protein F6K09_21035 [Merismopedia sp. SIO2A8]|nr:hypothetical protein [Merismopedia sp. SIO2A8]
MLAVLVKALLKGSPSNAEEGMRGYEDMLHIVLHPPKFELIYLTQQRRSRRIWGYTKNLHISLQVHKRANRQAPRFICILSSQKQDYGFGQHLSYEEQEWLVSEISIFLKSVKLSS